ncbi:hypothetical protein EXM22_06875 [Oceanispirochaeta crateris]|jgi:hypothetical protein|uniref:Uncharacterized protein n=1 Tax=Oceanispirochaeta crateris TaxID=2518645 RepID=A0A5C1QHV4_9SPIO|nr:hypothetical protein [Oceanispirochaeta crateris]QEN07725.1 hypothetical protein EXM22_06875 [Oceanispirochaeta crateris]
MTAPRIIGLVLLLIQAAVLPSQEMNGPLTEPLPYQDVEFPEWAHDARRFEVILFGSFPLTYIMSSLVYEVATYAGTGFNSEFSLASEKKQDELKFLLITSAALSGVIAVGDLIIAKIIKNQSRNQENEYPEFVEEEKSE